MSSASGLPGSGATIAFIFARATLPMMPSTDPKSALAFTGLRKRQSLPFFVRTMPGVPAASTVSESTASRANFSTVFSRKANVVRLSESSMYALTSSSFGCPSTMT